MASDVTDLAERLRRVREQLGFTQDDIAQLTGQPRPVVSDWERGTRRPNSHQIDKLAIIFRIPREELLGESAEPRPDFERLLFRDAGEHLDPKGRFEIQRFLAFLDAYSELLNAMDEPPGLLSSPFKMHEGFSSKEDVRRRAEDARALLKLGSGPIANLPALADAYGMTVYYAPLGADLRGTVSGAFLPHHRVGFSILLNGETTPGRQLFTLAHEIAHALFHGDRLYVNYFGRRESAERFANGFAGEFLVPTHHLRATVEGFGVPKVTDPAQVVHLQRYYSVSYDMMLVRLSQANLVADVDRDRLKHVRPVHLAAELGYQVEAHEWSQDPETWGLARYPQRFLRLLRQAFAKDLITVGGAASITGLAAENIEEFLADQSVDDGEGEFAYFTESS